MSLENTWDAGQANTGKEVWRPAFRGLTSTLPPAKAIRNKPEIDEVFNAILPLLIIAAPDSSHESE